MADEINRAGSTPPIRGQQPLSGAEAGTKARGTSAASPITRTEGTGPTDTIPVVVSADTPTTPKPAEDTKLTPEQSRETAEKLKQAASELEELADRLGKTASNAFDEHGQIRAEYKALMGKYQKLLDNPSFSIKDIPAGDQDKAFDIFALLLILNKLSSSQRATLFKAMQLEQKNIQASLEQKAGLTKTKGVAELITTLIGSLGGGVISIVGATFGGPTSNNIMAQTWSAAGKMTSEAIGGGSKAVIGLTIDTDEARRAKEEQEAQYAKSMLESGERQIKEQAAAMLETADRIRGSDTGVKSQIARNI